MTSRNLSDRIGRRLFCQPRADRVYLFVAEASEMERLFLRLPATGHVADSLAEVRPAP
jgi:hypothetical protein